MFKQAIALVADAAFAFVLLVPFGASADDGDVIDRPLLHGDDLTPESEVHDDL